MDLDIPDEIAVATWLNEREGAKRAVSLFAHIVKNSTRRNASGDARILMNWNYCFDDVMSEDEIPLVVRSALFLGNVRRPLDSIPAIVKLVEGENLAHILLHACVDPPEEISIQYTATHYHKAFNRTYQGNAAENFNTALHNTYSKLYKQDKHYGRIISILQSSATGKSRLVKELGNFVPTLSICLRKPVAGGLLSAWPPGDDPVYEFFRENSDNNKGEELAAAFLGALVTSVRDMLPVRNRKDPRALLKAWELDKPDLSENSTRHKNFDTVCALAKQNLSVAKEVVINLRALITPKSSISTPDIPPPVTVNWHEELYKLFCDQPFNALAEELRKNGHGFFLIAFDECTALNMDIKTKTRFPQYHMSLIALQRIIKAADHAAPASGVQFWYPFLDTSSAIFDLYPRRGEQVPSWRLMDQLDPLPPWPHMGFDQLLQEDYDRYPGPPKPQDALLFQHLKHYGRPYWATEHTTNVLHAAKRKLFGAEDFFPGSIDHVFAAFSRRICLETTNAEAASRLSVEAVRSHMRYAHGVVDRAFIVTSAPSEPMLSLAAADALSTPKSDVYQKALDTFLRQLIIDAPLIEQGLKGELLSRLILTMARDVNSVISKDRRGVKPVALKDFLVALLGSRLEVPSSLDAYCTGGHINFTHFVQLNEDLAIITPDFLYYCWCRGTAIQCSFSQPGIDGIIPCYWGSLDQPFDKNKLGMIAYQVKAKINAALQALEDSLTCPCLCENPESPTSPVWKPKHIMLLMDLGTSTKFQSAKTNCCRISFKKPVVPTISRWKAYLPNETARWCIAVRGFGDDSYPNVVDPKLKSLLSQLVPRNVQLHAGLDGFDQYQTAGDKATATHSTLDQERCKFRRG